MRRRLAAVLGILGVLVAGTGTAASASTGPEGFRPFAPDSVWNLPLRPDVPLSPRSSRHVRWLEGLVAERGTFINSTTCGMPLYWARPGTRRVPVRLDHPVYMDPALVRAWAAVPMPPEARPARCPDRNLAVAQEQPDGTVRAWEFWAATRARDGSWSAKWGGAIDDVMADRGIASGIAWRDPLAPAFQARQSKAGWGVTASSVSMLAGVVTLEELDRGRIPHALALATTDAARGQFLWPAQRTDGGLSDPDALPQGARLRIDPDLDLDAIAMAPLVRMLAEAAQRYGIVVRDRTFGPNVFYTQEPPRGAPSAVRARLGGRTGPEALEAFPWAHLQLLAAERCTDFRGCRTTSRAVVDVDPGPARGSVVLDTSNSVLEHPRAAVRWDLDGDGRFETAGGTGVKRRLDAGPGRHTVGVRMVLRDGQVVEGTRRFRVRGAARAR